MLMLINLDSFKILKVVPTETQAFYWADILLPTGSYYVNDISMLVLQSFSVQELTKLYVNTTGKQVPPRCENSEMLCGLILNLKAELLDETDTVSLYAKLKREPSMPVASIPIAEKDPVNRCTIGTRTKNSGQREVIFAAANAKWNEMGNPTDMGVIRKMRIDLMNELEAQGVKRTTASTTLGAWQKEQPSLG